MHTERLYYVDPYRTTFSANVIARAEHDGKPAVALDQTAFYAEGGGQPADTGTLGGIAVEDVQSDGDLIWHLLAAPLAADLVQGEIDWARRFDHMQQHHGQHLLSAAFEHLFDLRTVSFHLGIGASTIDLAGTELTAEQAAAAEDLTNQVIWEDRPVLARFVSADELAAMTLRKAPTVKGPIRIVSVPDFDHSPCGGTHPRSTGGVGVLHIRRWERRGDTIRVEFMAGARALRDLRWKNATLNRLASAFSVGTSEVEAAVARAREAEERSRKKLEALGSQLVVYEAQELIAHADIAGIVRVVRQAFEERPLDEVRALAKHIADGGCVAVLGLRGAKTQIIIARAEHVEVDCGTLLRETLQQFGGRGGGQSALAQGGLPDSSQLEAALDVVVERLRQG